MISPTQLNTIFQLLNDSEYKVYTNFSDYELEMGVLTNKDLKTVSNFDSFLEIFTYPDFF